MGGGKKTTTRKKTTSNYHAGMRDWGSMQIAASTLIGQEVGQMTEEVYRHVGSIHFARCYPSSCQLI
jgi:hypothetical protein